VLARVDVFFFAAGSVDNLNSVLVILDWRGHGLDRKATKMRVPLIAVGRKVEVPLAAERRSPGLVLVRVDRKATSTMMFSSLQPEVLII